jgi:hypothetical protein
MNAPPSRLLRLLQELDQATPMIRRDLPGWYPQKLLPVLRAIEKTITRHDVAGTDLDFAADRLAKVLESRPETATIARVLEVASVAGTDRAMQGMDRLPETIVLPGRLENECVLLREIIDALPEQEKSTPEPPVSPKPAEAP